MENSSKPRRRGRSKSPETKRKIEFALDLLKNKPELIQPQIDRVRAARIKQRYFICSSPQTYKQRQANLLKRTASPTGHHFTPSSVTDTSAPSCATKREDKWYKHLANVDPRIIDFKIRNPATRKVDEAFTASMIERYRGKSSETEVTSSGVAHEELPGASVLKRFREELGMSSETVTTDSSVPTTGIADRVLGEPVCSSATVRI
ncbi:hypothetical protein Tco_0065437 [Tanacetum coccineum]